MDNSEQQQSLSVNFEDLTYEQVMQELREVADPTYLEARDFYTGEHWKNGDYWVGPHPSEDEDGEVVWSELEQGLVAHPATEEIVQRHRDAVVGQEPFWAFVPRRPLEVGEAPNDGEEKLIKEIEAFVTNWWEDHDVLDVFQDATEDMLLGGRGIGRLMIPEGNLATTAEGTDVIEAGDFEEQIDKIWPTFIPADEGVVPRDPLTMKKFGVFAYEVTDALTGGVTKLAEITFIDAEGQTVIKTVAQENGAKVVEPAEARFDLKGRLTMFEMRSKPLITEPILSHQKLLNKAGTMLSINVNLGGFLERVILNGQLPGEWEGEGEERKFIPAKFEVGSGSTNQISGIQVGVREDGSPIIADPRIQYREPVDVACFKETLGISYRTVLTAARQLHVLIAADANASGEARKQARDDFTKSLKKSKTRLDRFGRWMLETVVRWAATLAGTPDKYEELRCVFNTQLDPGPISADDRAAIVSEYQTDLRSQEGAMALLGIDDTAAEQAKIAAEKKAKAAAEAELLKNDPLKQAQLKRVQLGLAADEAALNGGTPPPKPPPPTAPPTA